MGAAKPGGTPAAGRCPAGAGAQTAGRQWRASRKGYCPNAAPLAQLLEDCHGLPHTTALPPLQVASKRGEVQAFRRQALDAALVAAAT